MRLIFVHWVYEDRGSAQDLYNYREAASHLGHEVVIYGPPELSSFHYSLEVSDTDAVVFVVEWTTQLQYGDQLDWLRLLAKVPRHGWDRPAPWTNDSISPDAYANDPEYLQRLGVTVTPPVRFDQVIASMGNGVFTPVVYRPLFERLQLVTCRTFETPAANTIPLFGLDSDFVEETYGQRARDLVLGGEHPEALIREVIQRPTLYAEIVEEIRRELSEKHSYAVRLRELVRIIEE